MRCSRRSGVIPQATVAYCHERRHGLRAYTSSVTFGDSFPSRGSLLLLQAFRSRADTQVGPYRVGMVIACLREAGTVHKKAGVPCGTPAGVFICFKQIAAD